MSDIRLIVMSIVFIFSFSIIVGNAFGQLNDNISQFSNASNISILDNNSTESGQSKNIFGDSNDLKLYKLYNLTSGSVVKVVTNDADNYSLTKTGTGFIIESDGNTTIITSSSLVSENDNFVIIFSNGNSYESELLGADPISNLAVLSTQSIPEDMINPLNLTNSTNLQVGDGVFTIGSTEEYSHLFDAGIISGTNQPISSFDKNASNSKIPTGIVINLDLNTGFAGSPILDSDGDAIGMNIQNFSSDFKNLGYSYAVPSNTINNIVPSLLTQGYYLHPWLGVSGTNVSPDIAKALNLTETRGFLVIATADQSPADRAGILGGDNTTSINGRPITLGGDVILQVDNQDIQDINDILTYIENEKNVGDNIVITVLRNGLLQSINVLLQPNPSQLPSLLN